jgi:hypothetical protein
MKLTPTLGSDLSQIEEWMAADTYLQNAGDSSWWLTGTSCLLAFCGQDDEGPVFYVKLVRDGDFAKMYTVFGPVSEVAPKRIAKAILAIVPQLGLAMKDMGYKGICFETKNEALVNFMKQLGFKTSGDIQKWQFEEVN